MTTELFHTVKHYSSDMTAADMLGRIRNDRPELIVECGCHDGRDTERFLATFPQCHMMCFEPDPRPLEREEPPGFLRRIGNDHRVSLYRCAVSDQDGWTTLYRSSGSPPGKRWEGITDWDHSSSIQRPTGHYQMSPWCTFPEGHQIRARTETLDGVVTLRELWAEIALIWVDVQGAEAAVIRGATNTLKKTHWFYTEFYDRPMYEGQPNLETITAMLPGWELVAIYGGYNALFRNKEFS